MATVGAIAAVIGGSVVFGSNTTTSTQAAADIKAADVLARAALGLRTEPLLIRRRSGPYALLVRTSEEVAVPEPPLGAPPPARVAVIELQLRAMIGAPG